MIPRRVALFRSVFLVGFATLLYEIALIRVLSFTIWYHFAYVVISTALLGFGAAGTLVAIRPSIGAQKLRQTLASASVLAALAGAGFLALMTVLPFDPLQITTSPRHLCAMLAYQVGATVPFFFSGLVVSLALREAATAVDRLYFWDLAGAGLGCVLSVPLMDHLGPPRTLLLACAGLAAAAAVLGGRPFVLVAAPIGSLLVGLAVALHPTLTPAASKHLSMHIATEKLAPVFMRWTSLFRTDVVTRTDASPQFTDLHEWGLSHIARQPVQRMWGFLTHDGSAGAPIYDLSEGRLDFMLDHVLRLPYLVARENPSVLVIGVGGGRDVLAALRFDAAHVVGVELDPVTIELLRGTLGSLSRGAFAPPRVELVAGEGRHFVQRSRRRYDVIQITGADTLAAQSSGAYILAENYLYTTEAFHTYLDHLEPRGVLSIAAAEWDPNEPQSTGRMVLIARQALLERGIGDPERHIIAVSSNHLLADILVRTEAFDPAEIERVGDLARRLDFTPLVLAGADAHPMYRKLMRTEGGARDAMFAGLPYVLSVVTDDAPFFFRFFRWRDLPKQTAFGPAHTTALGQLVLAVLFVSLAAFSVLFILAPLLLWRRRGLTAGKGAFGIVVYFASLGLGFMMLEISLMQRFVLYLGHPTYALSVVLFSLLASLGCGSYLSRRFVERTRPALQFGLAGVIVLVALYRFGLPLLERWTLHLPLASRVAIAIGMLVPLGTLLGMFFPLGIRRAERIHHDLVPWAWSINGCASVTASVLAVVIAMEWGFGAVWLGAIAVYASGVAAFLWLTPETAG